MERCALTNCVRAGVDSFREQNPGDPRIAGPSEGAADSAAAEQSAKDSPACARRGDHFGGAGLRRKPRPRRCSSIFT